MSGHAQPTVSVVIPTHRRRASLERVLGGLAKQAWPPERLQVLVISDGWNDSSVEMALALQLPYQLRVFEQANQGPAAARNLGLAQAEGDLILFLDDDVVPCMRLVAEHARSHKATPDLVVIGPMLEPPGRLLPWVRWESRTLAEQYRAMVAGEWAPTPWQFYTGNASVRREHLRRAGGFDPRYRRAEDIELGFRLQRLGLTFAFNPAALGIHVASRSYRSWLRTAYQYGCNDILFGTAELRVVPEFQKRHRLTKALVRWGLRHRSASGLLPVLGGTLIRASDALRLRWPAHFFCSAIFNLVYWFGISDQIGSPQAALALIEPGQAGGRLSRALSALPIGARKGRI